MPHGRGTVHDEKDPGEMRQQEIGYIRVTKIRDKIISPDDKIQLIPFIQSDPPTAANTSVNFDIEVVHFNSEVSGREHLIRVAHLCE